MAQNVVINGATYSDVPSISVPKQSSGFASFIDTSDADAVASDILSGKTAYVNGEKITGTGSGGGTLTLHEEQFTFSMTEKHQESSTTMTLFPLPISNEAKAIISEQYNNSSLTISIIPRVFPTQYHGFAGVVLRNDFINLLNASKVNEAKCRYTLQYASSSIGVTTYDLSDDRTINTGRTVLAGQYYSFIVHNDGTLILRSQLNYASWETGDWDVYIRWVDTESGAFSYTMNRTLFGGRTTSGTAKDTWSINPPNKNYAFGEFLHSSGGQNFLDTSHDIYTNMTANSVDVTNSSGGNGICYPFKVTGEKTYTVTFSSAGAVRVYFGWYNNKYWTEDTSKKISTAGDHTVTLVAPTGTNIYGAIIFGAGTDGNAQYTNVSIVES